MKAEAAPVACILCFGGVVKQDTLTNKEGCILRGTFSQRSELSEMIHELQKLSGLVHGQHAGFLLSIDLQGVLDLRHGDCRLSAAAQRNGRERRSIRWSSTAVISPTLKKKRLVSLFLDGLATSSICLKRYTWHFLVLPFLASVTSRAPNSSMNEYWCKWPSSGAFKRTVSDAPEARREGGKGAYVSTLHNLALDLQNCQHLLVHAGGFVCAYNYNVHAFDGLLQSLHISKVVRSVLKQFLGIGQC